MGYGNGLCYRVHMSVRRGHSPGNDQNCRRPKLLSISISSVPVLQPCRSTAHGGLPHAQRYINTNTILVAGRRSVEETSHQSVEETSHGPVARSRLPVEIFRLHKMQHPKQCLRQPFRRIFVAFFDSCLTSKRKFDSSGLAAFADCLPIHSRHL